MGAWLLDGELAFVLRCIGRVGLPVWGWAIAEGYACTRDYKGYLGRVLLVGVVAVGPYYLLTERCWNPVFSLGLGLLILRQVDLGRWWAVVGVGVPVFCGGDWYMAVVPVAAGLGRDVPSRLALVGLVTVVFSIVSSSWNMLGLFGLLLIAYPLGISLRPGRWLKLAYYPGHLAAIAGWLAFRGGYG
jgi:hypothetical protein